MRYTKIEKLGWKVPVLGFGAGLVREKPKEGAEGERPPIDEAASIDLLRYAVDNGITWFDSAYPYQEGKHEIILGKAFRDGYRERVKIVTKLPSWEVKSAEDFDRFLEEQLERLQTDYVDIYLLHALRADWWEKLHGLGVLYWAERKMSEGAFHALGFSFHDSFPVLKDIIDAYDNWSLCQVQYNFMDVDNQAGRQGIRYAGEKGIPTAIMEPLRGGQIPNKIPDSVAAAWATAPGNHTPADRALRWLWNQPEVTVVLSGMVTKEEIDQNIASAEASGVGQMDADEIAAIERVRKAYRAIASVPCTQCRYCMPCPHGVDIPRVFEIYNDALMYDDLKRSKMFYNQMPRETMADHCIECGECEEVCSQSIAIIEWLAKAHAALYVEKKPPTS
jgi:hypothetical protein